MRVMVLVPGNSEAGNMPSRELIAKMGAQRTVIHGRFAESKERLRAEVERQRRSR